MESSRWDVLPTSFLSADQMSTEVEVVVAVVALSVGVLSAMMASSVVVVDLLSKPKGVS